MSRNDDIGFADLHTQLRITNRLLIAQLRSSMKQVELIKLLASTGASNAEIADVLGTTAATVKTTLQRARKLTRTTETSDGDIETGGGGTTP